MAAESPTTIVEFTAAELDAVARVLLSVSPATLGNNITTSQLLLDVLKKIAQAQPRPVAGPNGQAEAKVAEKVGGGA